MAGASFGFRLEGDRELLSALDRFIRRGQNLKPFYADVGESLLKSHQERWDRQEAPDGTKWKHLDKAYELSVRKRLSKGHDKILVLDTYLRDTGLSYTPSHSGLQFGANSKYAATHQFGDPSRNIPERPFLGLSQEDEQAVHEIINKWLSGP
jgi:phage virion morphogenesis protein